VKVVDFIGERRKVVWHEPSLAILLSDNYVDVVPTATSAIGALMTDPVNRAAIAREAAC